MPIPARKAYDLGNGLGTLARAVKDRNGYTPLVDAALMTMLETGIEGLQRGAGISYDAARGFCDGYSRRREQK